MTVEESLVKTLLLTGPITVPGQWNCATFADTRACAAATLTAYTPTASGSSAYGFTALPAVDTWNSTPFFRNVLHNAPAALNPHGF